MLEISFSESFDRFIDRITNVAALNIAPSGYLGVTQPFSPDLGSVMVRSEWEGFNKEPRVEEVGIGSAI